MNLKIALSILMLLALFQTSVGVEPLYLGSGPNNQAVNLDAGAKQPSHNYNYGRSGFAAPSTPQAMALSSTLMTKQAEDLKDEAKKARDETVSVWNETLTIRDEIVLARDDAKAKYDQAQALLEKIDEKESSVGELLKKAESSALAAAVSAEQAEEFLNKTDDAFSRSLGLMADMQGNLSQIKSMLQEAKTYDEHAAVDVSLARGYLNQTQLAYNSTAVIYNQSAALYKNMTLFAKEIQVNSEQIRALMTQKAAPATTS